MRKSTKAMLAVFTAGMVMTTAVQFPGASIGGVQVYAEETTTKENITAQGKCGDNVTYKYDSATNTLIISGTGAMWDESGFAKPFSDTENIVIEKGITEIGAYSFYDLYPVKTVTIADTVTTIKEYAFGNIEGSLEIPASVTSVGESAVRGAGKLILRGDIQGYATGALQGYLKEIVLYGSAENIGKATKSASIGTVTIAPENTKCKSSNGCIMSSDGKTLYRYMGTKSTVKIPDSVVTIGDFAFYGNEDTSTVTLGKNVKEIGAFAFADSELRTVKTNKKLKNIKTGAFEYSSLKSIDLKTNVKLGLWALKHTTTINYTGKFKKAHTTIYVAGFEKGKYYINYAKVAGAKGYEIKVYKGKKAYKYTTTKNLLKQKMPTALSKKYKIKYMDSYYLYNGNKVPKGAYYVTVRPYKVVKGKKVYGKWSEKAPLTDINDYDDDDDDD